MYASLLCFFFKWPYNYYLLTFPLFVCLSPSFLFATPVHSIAINKLRLAVKFIDEFHSGGNNRNSNDNDGKIINIFHSSVFHEFMLNAFVRCVSWFPV